MRNLVWLLFPLAVSCSKPAPPAPAPAAEELGAPSIPWKNKTRAQRKEYMGLFVYPKMKEIFQAFDAKEFAEFKCQTCHGDNMEDPAVDFKMPNKLFPLPLANAIEAGKSHDAKEAAFMIEKVLPAMTQLLGGPPYDHTSGQGMFCHTCHKVEKE